MREWKEALVNSGGDLNEAIIVIGESGIGKLNKIKNEIVNLSSAIMRDLLPAITGVLEKGRHWIAEHRGVLTEAGKKAVYFLAKFGKGLGTLLTEGSGQIKVIAKDLLILFAVSKVIAWAEAIKTAKLALESMGIAAASTALIVAGIQGGLIIAVQLLFAALHKWQDEKDRMMATAIAEHDATHRLNRLGALRQALAMGVETDIPQQIGESEEAYAQRRLRKPLSKERAAHYARMAVRMEAQLGREHDPFFDKFLSPSLTSELQDALAKTARNAGETSADNFVEGLKGGKKKVQDEIKRWWGPGFSAEDMAAFGEFLGSQIYQRSRLNAQQQIKHAIGSDNRTFNNYYTITSNDPNAVANRVKEVVGREMMTDFGVYRLTGTGVPGKGPTVEY